MRERLGPKVARVRGLVGGKPEDEDAPVNLRRQVGRLRARVTELEQEMMEHRQLARRIAELTDVVTELLLPEDQQDPRRLEERLKQVRARS
jgi:hypothetical protein